MNIIELDKLLASIPSNEPEMIAYYQAMRRKLVKDICVEINTILDNDGLDMRLSTNNQEAVLCK